MTGNGPWPIGLIFTAGMAGIALAILITSKAGRMLAAIAAAAIITATGGLLTALLWAWTLATGRRLAPPPAVERYRAPVDNIDPDPGLGCLWCTDDDPSRPGGVQSWWNQKCTCATDCKHDACLWHANVGRGLA